MPSVVSITSDTQLGAQGEGAAEISQGCAHLLKNLSLPAAV